MQFILFLACLYFLRLCYHDSLINGVWHRNILPKRHRAILGSAMPCWRKGFVWANLLLLCCTEMARLFLEIFISNTIALQRPYHKAIKSKETILIVMAFMSECFSRGIRHLNKILHAIFVDLDLGLLNLFSNYSFTENTWHET